MVRMGGLVGRGYPNSKNQQKHAKILEDIGGEKSVSRPNEPAWIVDLFCLGAIFL